MERRSSEDQAICLGASPDIWPLSGAEAKMNCHLQITRRSPAVMSFRDEICTRTEKEREREREREREETLTYRHISSKIDGHDSAPI